MQKWVNSSTKEKTQKEYASDLNDPEHKKWNLLNGRRKTGYNRVQLSEGVLGKVIVDEKVIKDSWKEYMENW